MSFYRVDPISFESVSSVTSTNSVDLGTRRHEAGIDYLYVYNAGASTIAQGKMGFIPSSQASNIGLFYVTGSNAASQAGCRAVVGVAHNADIAASKYGWLATRGVVFGTPDASEISANSGVELVPGIDGGFVAYAGTSATGVPVAYTVNSFVTTVGTGKIAFKSPLFG